MLWVWGCPRARRAAVGLGRDAADSCGAVVKRVSAFQPHGVFTAEALVDIWADGPGAATSSEEPDGTIKPMLGAGQYWEGPSMRVHHGGGFKPIVDGMGVCPSG